MRKAIALLLVLVVLCSGCIIAAHAVVNTQRDQVVISENVIYGDKLAADGVNIIRKADWDERLHWTTDYNIGAENKYGTEFKFTQNREYERYSGRYSSSGLNFGVHANGGIGSSHEITREDLSGIFRGYEDLCLDVMERAPAGEEYTEVVKIADYHEFYPLNVNLDLQELFYLHRYSDDSGVEYVRPLEGDECHEVNEALNEYFKIPVTDDARAEVTVYKEPSGIVTDVNVHTYFVSENENIFRDFMIYSTVISEKGAYFAFDCGENIDFTHIPGGCGIYCLPFGASFEYDGSTYPTADVDGLSMVYPLDVNTRIENFFYDEELHRLVLITVENGHYVFTSIEPDTMETVQQFEIADCEDGGVWHVNRSDGFIVLYLREEKFTVIDILENGEYALSYVVDRCPEDAEELFWFNSSSKIAYDGKRLALAWDKETEESPYVDCGFCIAVYDETGLLYFGEYDSGLMTGKQSNDYGYYCAPSSGVNIVLSWK